MKTIRIMIVASDEMYEEKLEFSNLIMALNKALSPRGIELERIKWTPDDGSFEDYFAALSDCEMCLTLYWRELADNSEKELDAAYQNLKDGNNPKHLYVFFKESDEKLTEALQIFKANFVTNYGHFFCKFSNVDTMNLQFVLMFEAFQNRLYNEHNKLATVSDGKVKIVDESLVNLDHVPFAAFNREYQRLRKELEEYDLQIAEVRKAFRVNPDNEDFEDQLMSLRSKRKNLAEEFEKYQMHLYDIALGFAMHIGETLSERMQRAKDEFEKGNVIEADRILNMEEMKREAEQEIRQFEQHRKNLEMTIEEFRMKADTVMANTEFSITDRFAQACEAYEQAVSISKTINYDKEALARIMFDYAYLLQRFNRMYEAVSFYAESLALYRQLAEISPDTYLDYVAASLNNLALLQRDLNRYDEAEANSAESLAIRRQLAEVNPDAYLPGVATSLDSLALLQRDLNHYAEAEANFVESLAILRQLAEVNSDAYLPDVAMTLNNLALLQNDLNRYAEAEANYTESLVIRRQLAEVNPNAYLPYVAESLNNLAILQHDLNRYAEAEANYTESLAIYRQLAEVNSDAYLSYVAISLNNLAGLQNDLNRYAEAEANYTESLAICRQLADINPDAYLPHVAMTLNNLASLQSDLNRYAEAEANHTESLIIRRQLAEVNPDAYLSDVAMTLNNLANLQSDLNRYAEAEANHTESLAIYRQLAEVNPDAYLPYVAISLNNLAVLQRDLNRYDEAEDNFAESLAFRRQLAEVNPDVYLPYVASSLNNFAELKSDLNCYEDAETYYKEALSIYEQLETQNHGMYSDQINEVKKSLSQLSAK